MIKRQELKKYFIYTLPLLSVFIVALYVRIIDPVKGDDGFAVAALLSGLGFLSIIIPCLVFSFLNKFNLYLPVLLGGIMVVWAGYSGSIDVFLVFLIFTFIGIVASALGYGLRLIKDKLAEKRSSERGNEFE